ncbi:MAG: hypothetical protein KatS3mg126_0915 [Lysobacteraceae bacterium]|nr:MAG: hypothetical protein KatS3mg126_0915 [Xanthomonadaceae bacterium]
MARHAARRKWIWGTIIAAGAAGTAVCLLMLASVGLPYQDAPVDLLLAQQRSITRWTRGLAISLLTLAAGLAGAGWDRKR